MPMGRWREFAVFAASVGVEVDIDDVVEGADGDGDGFLEHLVVEGAIAVDVGIEDDGAEVADGGFLIGGVERDLGAEVAGVDDAAMILRGADVARVFKGDPRVAGLEDHFQHGFPKLDGGELAGPDFALGGLGFVDFVFFLKGFPVEVVEIRGFVGAEEGPVLAVLHAFHEEVGHPVRGVHVVAAAAVVAGVLAELEEVLDVVVPCLKVGAAGALAFPALVDGEELVVVELEERDDALGLAVGALDVAAGAADCGPRSAEAARPLGEVGVFRDAALHDGLDGVVHLVEVAGGELGVEGAGIEKGGRGGAEAAAFVEIVKADDPLLALGFLVFKETHGDAHPEELRGLDALVLVARLVDDEVAVVEGLYAEVVEIEVGGGVECVGEAARARISSGARD